MIFYSELVYIFNLDVYFRNGFGVFVSRALVNDFCLFVICAIRKAKKNTNVPVSKQKKKEKTLNFYLCVFFWILKAFTRYIVINYV